MEIRDDTNEEIQAPLSREQSSIPSISDENLGIREAKDITAIMNKYATGYLASKEDTSPENVKSSFEASIISDNGCEREEITKQMEEDKAQTYRPNENTRLEKSERTEFSISRTQNQTAIKAVDDPKRIIAVMDDPNAKLLEEIRAQQFMTEKDYALIEKLFKVNEDSTVLSKDEVDTIRELLLCMVCTGSLIDVTDIVGDHILEDANIHLIGEKFGKNTKTTSSGGVTVKKFDLGEDAAELKDTLIKYKKKVKELEDYSAELQRELTQTQEKLMKEMEEKNKYMKLANNYVIEKEELKQNNAQLAMKINTMEKSAEQLQKKLKYYEDQITGAAFAAKKEESKKPKEDDLRKALELGSSSEEPLSKLVPKTQPVRGKKEAPKKPSAVQINLSNKPSI